MGIYYNNKWCKEKVEEEEEENARRWPLSLAPEKVVYLFTIMYGFFCRQDGKCACIAWYLCCYYIRIYIHTSYKIYYLDFILLLFSARLKRRPIYFFYPFYYIYYYYYYHHRRRYYYSDARESRRRPVFKTYFSYNIISILYDCDDFGLITRANDCYTQRYVVIVECARKNIAIIL